MQTAELSNKLTEAKNKVENMKNAWNQTKLEKISEFRSNLVHFKSNCLKETFFRKVLNKKSTLGSFDCIRAG